MLDKAFLKEVSRLLSEGTAFCTVTIVDARGSIPQVVGARAILTRQGLHWGTIGGGRIEERGKAQAAQMLADGANDTTRFERINLNQDLGMTCAGEVALFYEAHRPELSWNIAVFGAGHVAQKLCRFLIEMDCRVTCIDTREEWLSRLPQHEKLDTLLVRDFTEGVPAIQAGATVLVMTMGHVTDVPVLRAIHERRLKLSYLGVIGSVSKAAALRRQLKQDGLDQAFIDRIVCPVGDKIGDNTPPEIAVGVLSQLVRLRRQPEEETS
jgi:xanthine dehydrogenase accessory factor